MQTLSVATTENWPTCLGHYRRRGDAPYKKRYAYVPNNSQTALLASYQNGSDTAYTYTYDDNGNITRIQQGTLSAAYTYDAANQLIREDNGFINQTVTYTYDAWGNILTKSEYPYTTGTLGTPSNSVNYTYTNSAWGDQLTSYNGETITYDAMGNPVSYRGYTTSFEGKQLVSAVKSGKNITFAYDENGLRTQKTVNNVTTNYYYNGSVLISQVSGNDTLLFSYDANGSVVSVNFNGTDYYYVRNGQGDVVKFIDGSGNTVTEYAYDTWGKLVTCTGSLSSTLGVQNPFRYRGYVYDTETGFYYLQSRYYDPEVGRFLSADVLLSTGQGVLGHNTFTYCLNNPVNRSDPSGSMSDLNTQWNQTLTDGGEQRYYERREKKRRAVFIYYDYEESGEPLKHFAFGNIRRLDYYSCDFIGVSNFDELRDEWNSIEGYVDDVFFVIHSSSDGFVLYPAGTYHSDFSEFQKKDINGKVYFYSCHAAGFAEKFAQQTGTCVVASTRGVSYDFFDGFYYAREDRLSNIFGSRWKEFDFHD